MTQVDEFGTAYLRLTLEIDKHIDGYVDAYYGPPDIKADVDDGERKSSQLLLDNLTRLQDMVPGDDLARRSFLAAELRSIETTLRSLSGEEFDYLDEVQRLYDFRPQLVDEAQLEVAGNELDTILPGSGDIGGRLEAWRKQLEVPKDKLPYLLTLAHNETRRRTREFVSLGEGEKVALSFASNVPWIARNSYKGQRYSDVIFNTDFAFSLLDLADVLAHEAYPGHHTEQALKELHIYHQQGAVEQASNIMHSPATVLAEGIAMTAVEIIFPEGSQYEWTADVLMPAAGLPKISAEEMRRVADASKRGLFYAYGVSLYAVEHATYKYHTGDMTEEQVVDYLDTIGLATPEIARQFFGFLSNPLLRTYIFTYTAGYDLIEAAAHGGDKKPLFKRLLVENVLPSELAAL